MSGHVFIIQGDLTKLSCDAWLMPCDSSIDIQPHWISDISAEWFPESSLLSDLKDGGERSVRVENWPYNDSLPFLTNTGGFENSNLQWYAEGVTSFLEKAIGHVKEEGFKSPCKREKPVVAIPIIGIGAGGASERAGQIVEALLPVMYEKAKRNDVDIALVIKDAVAYSAAQSVRRKFQNKSVNLWPDELSETLQKESLRLAGIAKRGDLVLFLGAGVSAGAGVPLWNELLGNLAKSANIFKEDSDREAFKDLDLLDKARLISIRLEQNNNKIGEIVARLISKYKYSSINHMILSSLPVSEVITTNYDQLFENTSAAIDKEFRILPYQPAKSAERWFLKMHGCISKPDDIVLTRSDYLGYNEQRSALRGIVQAMLITKHLLFIGFSLTDDNFHIIIEDVRNAMSIDLDQTAINNRHSFGTSLTLTSNPLFEELWSKDLDWVRFDSQKPQSSSILKSARLQEIFLDHLAYSTSSNSSHILDKKYESLLTDEEKILKKALLSLKDDMHPLVASTDTWAEIKSLLKRFGDN